MLDRTPLNTRAHGKWRSVLSGLGIAESFLTGKNGPCPMCGGKDRWRFMDTGGSGSWICNHCGHGGGVELVKQFLGLEFREAALRIEALLPGASENCAKATDESKARSAMTELWRSGAPVSPDDPAGRYLTMRCGITEYPPGLRFVQAMRYRDDETSAVYPGLIAKVTAPDGKPASVHRTYLTLDATKAPVQIPRRMMPGAIAKGSAVRLGEPSKTLGIAEGIETAIAASRIFGLPCWAALNARMMATWLAPDEVEEIVVFGDHDANYTGQAAAYVCAHKHAMRGRRARVEIPPQIGSDWDDALMAAAPAHPHHEDAA